MSGGLYGVDPEYKRRVRITDTTDRILEISYNISDKIFKSNDTIVDLIISENVENVIYIKTQRHLDTVILYNKVNYNYNNAGDCGDENITKEIDKEPIIVAHTFSGAYFKRSSSLRNNWSYERIDFDDLIITP